MLFSTFYNYYVPARKKKAPQGPSKALFGTFEDLFGGLEALIYIYLCLTNNRFTGRGTLSFICRGGQPLFFPVEQL